MDASKKRRLSILGIESALFCVILLMIWLDEYFDMPSILFGAPPRPYRVEEFLIEAVLVGTGTIIIMIITFIGLKRIEHFEKYLRVCAWCKNVWLNGEWVKFEHYMEAQHQKKSTHGICDACNEKLRRKGFGSDV